jgi:hypothetical protein
LESADISACSCGRGCRSSASQDISACSCAWEEYTPLELKVHTISSGVHVNEPFTLYIELSILEVWNPFTLLLCGVWKSLQESIFFLWLLTQNKILTRDNVNKSKTVPDDSCLFCCEPESVHHLFFDCAVAPQIWVNISDCLDTNLGSNFESVGKLWLIIRKILWLTCLHLLPCGGFGS